MYQPLKKILIMEKLINIVVPIVSVIIPLVIFSGLIWLVLFAMGK
jgi:hypothetical protein